MKRQWYEDELVQYWVVSEDERVLLWHLKPVNQLGLAIQLKFFQLDACFPRNLGDVPVCALDFIASQLTAPPELILDYDFRGRSSNRHRQLIREFLGIRLATPVDAKQLEEWLEERVLPFDQSPRQLRAAAIDWCREHRIEPSEHARIDRIVRSAIRSYEVSFHKQINNRLSAESKRAMDLLLKSSAEEKPEGDADSGGLEVTAFAELKTGTGSASVKSISREIIKLHYIDALTIPDNLFDDIPQKLIRTYRFRAAAEPPRELRRHPGEIRYTLLSAFVWQRRREVIDGLVELFIRIVHNIGARAEHRVVQVLLQDVRKVRGKGTVLYKLAAAALANADGVVSEVIFPVVSEQTLTEIMKEFEMTGPAYQHQIQKVMRASYSHHYRRMLPLILDALEFRSNNRRHRPVIKALEWLKTTRDSKQRQFLRDEHIPIEGIVPDDWEELIFEDDCKGRTQVNRITYELCVLKALRDRLRCREVWVVGAERFRNPNEDLPADFDTKRDVYYEVLAQPKDADIFIDKLQTVMVEALTTLDRSLPENRKVKILDRPRKYIRLSPLSAQLEPTQLVRLKAELGRRWTMTSLLDVLKEADLRIGFTKDFRSVATREIIDKRELQQRLLLCLYGLGTNTGIKAVSAGGNQISYDDLLRVRRKFIHKDALRNVIAQVVNAVLDVRRNEIWGEGTTACASDSKKIGAWDQNLMTEWHVRYGGRGVMIYWHIEKRSMCIYSQLKRCSSSEAAAMIEGVLRHCTDMEVEKNYVDSHGQSEVAFAFCYLLGFDLLPRLKTIASQKLSRAVTGRPNDYPNLQSILSRPVRWDLIRHQYDEIIKYSAALRMGSADAESILRCFTRNNRTHPTYRALAELGKAVKTMFLCRYLGSEALRREIHEGLNVVERWNGAQNFIYFGKRGEIATNRMEDQEISVLCLHLLQVCLVYINTLMIQRVLTEPNWFNRMEANDFRALTPLVYNHITPYGFFELDMDKRLAIEESPMVVTT